MITKSLITHLFFNLDLAQVKKYLNTNKIEIIDYIGYFPDAAIAFEGSIPSCYYDKLKDKILLYKGAWNSKIYDRNPYERSDYEKYISWARACLVLTQFPKFNKVDNIFSYEVLYALNLNHSLRKGLAENMPVFLRNILSKPENALLFSDINLEKLFSAVNMSRVIAINSELYDNFDNKVDAVLNKGVIVFNMWSWGKKFSGGDLFYPSVLNKDSFSYEDVRKNLSRVGNIDNLESYERDLFQLYFHELLRLAKYIYNNTDFEDDQFQISSRIQQVNF